jgi:hypothetical protein
LIAPARDELPELVGVDPRGDRRVLRHDRADALRRSEAEHAHSVELRVVRDRASQDRVARIELRLGPGKVITRDLPALGLIVRRRIRIRAEQYELEGLDWKWGLGKAD